MVNTSHTSSPRHTRNLQVGLVRVCLVYDRVPQFCKAEYISPEARVLRNTLEAFREGLWVNAIGLFFDGLGASNINNHVLRLFE